MGRKAAGSAADLEERCDQAFDGHGDTGTDEAVIVHVEDGSRFGKKIEVVGEANAKSATGCYVATVVQESHAGMSFDEATAAVLGGQ